MRHDSIRDNPTVHAKEHSDVSPALEHTVHLTSAYLLVGFLINIVITLDYKKQILPNVSMTNVSVIRLVPVIFTTCAKRERERERERERRRKREREKQWC